MYKSFMDRILYRISKKTAQGFFAAGHFAVKKKMLVSVKIRQIRFSFFFTVNCPTAKNPRAEKKPPHTVCPSIRRFPYVRASIERTNVRGGRLRGVVLQYSIVHAVYTSHNYKCRDYLIAHQASMQNHCV